MHRLQLPTIGCQLALVALNTDRSGNETATEVIAHRLDPSHLRCFGRLFTLCSVSTFVKFSDKALSVALVLETGLMLTARLRITSARKRVSKIRRSAKGDC